ncbi:MAG: hypothetical protein M1828_002006 [Chrysothrix sp. TS-e1954]|nr:MAG: hypothetical protein M1828_002006 [Chrysothrix sp. TS-e1954]
MSQGNHLKYEHEELPGYGENPTPAYEQVSHEQPTVSQSAPPPMYFGSAKEYGIYYPRISWIKDLVVRDDLTGRDAFFAAVSEARNKMDVVLHDTSAQGPVLGLVDMRSGKSIYVTVGPSTSPEIWAEQKIELKREKKLFGPAKFTLVVPKPGDRSQYLTFVWEKKDYKKQDDLKRYQKKALTNYEIQEESAGKVVGVYVENIPQNAVERGKLSIPARVPRDEHLYILLGTLAICEHARRNAAVSGQGRGLPGFLAMTMM